MEDAASWSGRPRTAQEMGFVKQAQGRTDMTELDMWKHTTLHV